MMALKETATALFLALLSVILQPSKADPSSSSSSDDGRHTMMFELKEKLEKDLFEFRDEVEESYQYKNRCYDKNMKKCFHSNYDACQSPSFPNPVCAEEGFNDACPAAGCGTVVDFTVSSIRLPPASSTHEEATTLMESVCFSQALDDYFVDKTYDDRHYWKYEWNMDLSPMTLSFGSSTGLLREFPARPAEDCDEDQDSKSLPWYQAAVSGGPKNVVLLLDTSFSMTGTRLAMTKNAAERVIGDLTPHDRIAVIPFSTDAEEIMVGPDVGMLAPASQWNKIVLTNHIRLLEAGGATKIVAGFDKAFETLQSSKAAVNCNTAILIITDGKVLPHVGVTHRAVIEHIRTGIAQVEEHLGHPVVLFVYSVSHDEDDAHNFPQDLACGVSNGIYLPLHSTASASMQEEQFADGIAQYKMFMSQGTSHDFVTWSSASNNDPSDARGITVSAPVFDRSQDPPASIGVVSLSLPLRALELATGIPLGRDESLYESVLSRTMCPALDDMHTCQKEQAGGLRGSRTTFFVLVEPSKCPNAGDLPTRSSLFSQPLLPVTTPFVERACCSRPGDSTEKCTVSENDSQSIDADDDIFPTTDDDLPSIDADDDIFPSDSSWSDDIPATASHPTPSPTVTPGSTPAPTAAAAPSTAASSTESPTSAKAVAIESVVPSASPTSGHGVSPTAAPMGATGSLSVLPTTAAPTTTSPSSMAITTVAPTRPPTVGTGYGGPSTTPTAASANTPSPIGLSNTAVTPSNPPAVAPGPGVERPSTTPTTARPSLSNTLTVPTHSVQPSAPSPPTSESDSEDDSDSQPPTATPGRPSATPPAAAPATTSPSTSNTETPPNSPTQLSYSEDSSSESSSEDESDSEPPRVTPGKPSATQTTQAPATAPPSSLATLGPPAGSSTNNSNSNSNSNETSFVFRVDAPPVETPPPRRRIYLALVPVFAVAIVLFVLFALAQRRKKEADDDTSDEDADAGAAEPAENEEANA